VPAEVDFYYGLGSRYSYLAASQLEALARDTGALVRWRPLYSGRLMRLAGKDPFAEGTPSGQYDPAYRQRDAEAWARLYGIPFREPRDKRFDPNRAAEACIAAERLGAVVAMSREVFRLIFVDEAPLLEDAAYAAAAVRAGLAAADFMRALEAPETAAAHEARLREAAARGAFGVPTFFVAGDMFWGNDRLPLLRQRLVEGRGT
jgi:2-hydroxychromene-2-carboxylate isomerase